MKYIIADDLSGANDTGVKFTKKGYNASVSIVNNQPTVVIPDNIDVFVVDTETRELESEPAREKLNSILKKLSIDQDDFVYKKVDSTLRGNIGVEIEEIMKFLKKDICIFSPSFPSHQRVTIDSYLMVDQRPLGASEYSSNHLKQEENSFIPAIMKKQTDFSVGQIHLSDVAKGPKAILSKINELCKKGNRIIVIDSIIENHLRDIFRSGFKFSGTVLFSGSAGLANHFPKNNNKPEKLKVNIENTKGPVIVIAGSRNSVVSQQINYLKDNLNLAQIKIDLEQIFSDRDRVLENYAAKSIELINADQDLLIYTDAIYNERQSINNKLMDKHHFSFRELEIEIKKMFGQLTSEIIKNTKARNLILTGGDVALGVCEELKIYSMNILDELLPGIPLTTANYKNLTLKIITKAGGFGKEDTLCILIDKLKND
ncbi:MAG TPA: four-carbon acid sugar kinase family protein [Candidatus Atribacteria bacterium]|nr:four-carbon acid sugar kinase family protein [Candidatus Atribacteria bacterium]